MYELPDTYLTLQTKLTNEELQISKKELQTNKMAYFHESWIYLPNSIRHNKYHKSPKTMTAFKNQIESIPSSIKNKFKDLRDTTIDSTMDSVWIPIENINKKEEIRNNNKENSNSEDINPDDIPF